MYLPPWCVAVLCVTTFFGAVICGARALVEARGPWRTLAELADALRFRLERRRRVRR